jgi:hypothetical protein
MAASSVFIDRIRRTLEPAQGRLSLRFRGVPVDPAGRLPCGRKGGMAQGAAAGRGFGRMAAGVGAALVLAQGCVLPAHWLPSVSGRVVDAQTGRPIAGAVVAVRFDARHGDLLPDRDLLAHQEAVTDADGRFATARAVAPGLSAWPAVTTEARVVGVMAEGYRCAAPIRVEGSVTIQLAPAPDESDRRSSCRPVAARPDETPRYLTAWRELYPRDGGSGRMVDERPLTRLLEARRAFGPGENCTGPVVDLALAPDGARVALRIDAAGRGSIEVIDPARPERPLARIPAPAETDAGRPRRLAWASADELLVWEPASAIDLSLAPSLTEGAGATEVVWRAAPPAARAPGGAPAARAVPIQPSDLNDEQDVRWLGRSFEIAKGVDPDTGLTSEVLHTYTPAGEEFAVALPGEPCGPGGQYGRPHLRIAADGHTGIDLRHLEGGCRAVAVHLTSGEWRRLDSSRAKGVCAQTRRVPLAQLRAALPGYAGDLEAALLAANGDPETSYLLRVDPRGSTSLEARDNLGEPLVLRLSPFPIQTPLRRIEVTGVASAGTGSNPRPAPAPAKLEPL